MDLQFKDGWSMCEDSDPSAWASDSPIDINAALVLLDRNRMYIEKGACSTLPSTVAEALLPVMSTNFTEMQSPRVDIAVERLIQCQLHNANTTFTCFFEDLYEGFRGLSQKKINHDGVERLEHIDWRQRGLKYEISGNFDKTGSFPIRYHNDKDEALATALHMPSPRTSFGISERVFNDAEMQANRSLSEWAGIAQSCWHTFLIFECAFGPNTSFELAEVRALRAGSTLVNADRRMKKRVGMLYSDERGIDGSTIVFSFCLTPTLWKLYVHWASFDVNHTVYRTRYHMNQIKRYLPDEQDSWISMRQDFERILDWGTSSRLNGPGGVREMLAKISSNESDP
ncbi:MAG: hypothetical protein LQ344_007919 [Seirophora lacunosa]|nr:MAG: hypothetical protein LQ344_007919 [Seirophora lacunosa]